MRQAIVWTNAGMFTDTYMCHYAAMSWDVSFQWTQTKDGWRRLSKVTTKTIITSNMATFNIGLLCFMYDMKYIGEFWMSLKICIGFGGYIVKYLLSIVGLKEVVSLVNCTLQPETPTCGW